MELWSLHLVAVQKKVSPLWLRHLTSLGFLWILAIQFATESPVKLSSPTYCWFGDPKKEPYYTQSNPSCLEGPMTWFSELRFVSFCFSHTSNPQSKLIKLSHCEAEGVLRPTFRPTFSEPRCCLKGSEANLISALINKTGEPHHGIQGKKTYFPHLQSCEEGSFTGCFHLLYWLECAVSGNSFNNIHQLAHTCAFTFCLQLNYRVTGQDQNPRKCWMIPKYLEYRIYAYKLWIHDHTICWYVVHKSQGDTRCVFPL